MNKVLVTGGSGMVGRFLRQLSPDYIYLTSADCDLTKLDQVLETWQKHRPRAVIHLAAKVGGIIDNIRYPADYYEQNILMNSNVLLASRLTGVERFIGVLSTCIYPDVADSYPMSESVMHNGPPTKTNFSYAYAKRSMAVHIDAYNEQYGTEYQYLIPCNLYGEYDKYGDNSHFVASLLKKIFQAKDRGEDTIELFGTGKPLRQFLYGGDLAQVIKHCIDNNITESFNVADNVNYTIEQIAKIAVETVCDGAVKHIIFDSTKPDGQYRKDVDTTKLRELIPGFTPTSLSEGLKLTCTNLTLIYNSYLY